MTAEYVQLVDRLQVQTSIRSFNHPVTDRKVTVIGTYHLGEPGYFAGLREAIDNLEANGAVVQCEGSRLVSCDESHATADELELLSQLRRADVLQDQRVAELGWTGQIDGLAYPPSWQIVDFSYLKIIRDLGMPLARTVARRKLRRVDWPDDDRNGLNRMRLGIAVLMRTVSQDQRLVQVAGRRDPTNEVLLKARNALALQRVAGTDRDTVLIWGLAHLPGLDAGLAEQGFVRSGAPQWHTVARRPTIPDALWRLATHRVTPARQVTDDGRRKPAARD
jgi:hypothetical protein